jgi:hypothetical protein
MGEVYGIKVRFKWQHSWSPIYTYLSDVPYKKGQALVVAAGSWYEVVKVVSCEKNPKLSKDLKYKYVLAPLEIFQND